MLNVNYRFLLATVLAIFFVVIYYKEVHTTQSRNRLSSKIDFSGEQWVERSEESVNEHCKCESWKSEKHHDFCYVDPQNSSSIGRKFDCSLVPLMESLNLIGETQELITLPEVIKDENQLVFVSATSADHFNVSVNSLKSIRKYYPFHKYILYGLELNESDIQQIPIDSNFEFRHFNTSCYPKFVNNWLAYHFKPLIIAEVMREHSVILWIDAHIQIVKSGLIRNIYEDVAEKRLHGSYSSVFGFSETFHSNYAVLHPDVLTYFPSNSIGLLQTQQQVQAGYIFVPRTTYTMRFFKWWVLCALTESCMSPPGTQRKCKFTSDSNKVYANCFRYDQSILNLLLLNDFQDRSRYVIKSLEPTFIGVH